MAVFFPYSETIFFLIHCLQVTLKELCLSCFYLYLGIHSTAVLDLMSSALRIIELAGNFRFPHILYEANQ